MGRWDDQFEGHAVFTTLAMVRERLDKIGEALDDAEEMEAHARLGRVLDHVEGSLKNADPELVPAGPLDQINGQLEAMASSLQQYEATPQATYLDQANSYADALLGPAAQLSPRASQAGSHDLQSAVSTFRRSSGQHLRNIEQEVSELQAKADEVRQQLETQETKITTQDARLDSVVSEFQAQFSTSEDQRRAEFNQAVEEGRSQLREAVDAADSAVKAAIEQASADLGELLEKSKTASGEALAEVQERADQQFKEFSGTGNQRVSQLDELLKKAVKTVGVIGSTGMAGGYQIVANDEKKAANFWRWIAVVGLASAVAATIFALWHGISEGFELDRFFAKVTVAVPLIALASYAARESSKHREQERINRQIELQLASLDAYLVTLPEPEQNRVRAKLADRFFGELKPAPDESTDTEANE